MSLVNTNKLRGLMIFLLVFSLTACEKDKTDPQPVIRQIHVLAPKPALVGRWKLVKWASLFYNTIDCENVYQTTVYADEHEVDFEFEIRSDGSVRNYRNDTLVETFFLTSVNSNSSSITGYHINDGERLFQAIDVEDSFELGDLIEATNPILDLDTYAGNGIWHMTGLQHYVKVE